MMMYSNRNRKIKPAAGWLTGIAILSLFIACEKAIDLNLDNVKPVIVIDGGVNDLNEVQVVRISTTYSFTEANKFNGLAGAKVVLTGSDGTTVNYTEKTTGIYNSPKFKGKPGTTYKLTVNAQGKTYTATSTMPQKVILNLLTFKELTVANKTRKYVAVIYDDPPGVENWYHSIVRFKGKVEFDVATDDRFNDGNKVNDVIFYDLSKDMVPGDTVAVEFQCVDKAVHRYFFSLGQNLSETQPVSPANPPSNFDNNALGVFSAYTTSSRKALFR
ncbi:DUF4249 domain-containing protein [Pedobacter cryoconitis]|uniref:DUF4249 domain-containing protein n=1 Tax=Pedobacter cryoconitis TaxID=188932 RepID=UPI00184D43DE|nr:DUF4249 domain-containing protein [Pedobacter cryoconitis]MBB5644779.1 hypothetical protein [Pedobacter cryoconitis]